MAVINAEECVEVTIGFYCAGQRFQYVTRWGRTGGVAFPSLQNWQNFKDWFTNNFIAVWQAAMSSTIECVGWQIEPVTAGGCIPYRENFPLGTYPGLQAAPVYSQNVSMLVSGNSADQIATGQKIRTAKTFLGPPPEGKVDTQVLQNAYWTTEIAALANALFLPFTGAIIATAYARVIGTLSTPTPNPTDAQYPITTWEARQTVFTQKRRLTPII